MTTFVSVNNAAGQTAGSGGTAGTASITPTMPASTVDNQTRIVIIQCHSGTSASTPTDWTALFKDTAIGTGAVASAAGQRFMSCYYRDKDSSWSAIPAFDLTNVTQNSHWIGVVAINKTSTAHTWDTPTFSTPGDDFGTPDTSHSVTTGSLTTHAGGFLIVGTANNDIATMSAGLLAQTGATLSATTERCDGGTTTGNDVSGKLHTCTVTAGASAPLTFTGTLNAATEGGSIVIEQTETAGAVNTGAFFGMF